MLMMPPDLTALSWCFGELRQSLMQADTQLGAALAGGESGTAELEQATLSLHRADGAMQLLVLPGVSQITRQADALVQAMLSAGVQLDEARLRSLRRAFHALIEYCEGLLRLDPPQPLHLFPYYRDLLLARGEQGAQPCDLFFPDLSVSLPVSQLPLGEDDPQLLGHARSMFERGLLALMRSPDSEGARSMQDAVSMVCASALASRDRAFWWVAQAFVDSLADATLSLDAQVKRLLARVNQK
ncbi:MAG: hypothetical protein VW339_09590, partial [Quisquiliibacterium sp.]